MMKWQSQAGFTLVEVLVALGVFSIAAMALVHLGNEAIVGARHVEQRFLASVEADNLMAEALVRPEAMPTGIESGTSMQRGRTFSWQRTVTAAGRETLYAVTVTVTDDQSGQELASRQTLMRVSGS